MHKQVRRSTYRGAGVLTTLALVGTLAGCGSDGADSKTVTLVTHDSFNVSQPLLREFQRKTGYTVHVLRGGDAGAAVNQAVLNKGNPQGDVFFGVDNTLLSRTLDQGLFTPYRAKGADRMRSGLQEDAGKHRVTPMDTGEVCVNYDRSYFEQKHLDPPRTFGDLIKPKYRNLLVTPNAATSSPGLGFLLGTAARYGDHGWQSYWKKLKANGVEVVDGWEQAYNDRFSGSSGGNGSGDRPLVVSYASSPPVEVTGKKPQPQQAPTGVSSGTCFRQQEFAGLLDGAPNEKGGKALLDFLSGREFQEDMPLSMYVNPARRDVRLPEVFTKYGADIRNPATMAPDRISAHREQWIKAWTSLVVK